MAWLKGFNFRNTSGYVTDSGDETYVVAASAYPTTRNSVTFGIESGEDDFYDRNNTVDRRLAGCHRKPNSGIPFVFRVDLPQAGTYRIRFAAGDYGADCVYLRVDVFDNNTSKASVVGAPSSQQFMDATSAIHTAANWPSNNNYIDVAFSSTICRIKIGSIDAQSGSSAFAHITLEQLGSSSIIKATSDTENVSESTSRRMSKRRLTAEVERVYDSIVRSRSLRRIKPESIYFYDTPVTRKYTSAIEMRATAAGIVAVGHNVATDLTPVAQNYADDVALLLIAQESVDDTVTVSGDAWVRISTWTQGSAARFWLYGRRNPTSASSPVVHRAVTTGRFWAIVREYTGVTTSGIPWEVVGTPAASVAYTDPFAIPGITTVTNNTMIICMTAIMTGNVDAITSVTADAPVTLDHAYHETNVTGGAVAVVRAHATKLTPGATGNIMMDFTTAPNNVVGGIAIALTEDSRTIPHVFSAKSLMASTVSVPVDGILSVLSNCTAIALGVVIRDSVVRSGGVPSLAGTDMILASSISSTDVHTEMFYLTGSFYSTLAISIPNAGAGTIWSVASGYSAHTDISSKDTQGTLSGSDTPCTLELTTEQYGGDVIVAMIGTNNTWTAYDQTGTELYGDAGYAAQDVIQDSGGTTQIQWLKSGSLNVAGTSAETTPETPFSDHVWENPTNALADDTSRASVSGSVLSIGESTEVLKLYGFDFSTIPDNATIDGVLCKVYGHYSIGTANLSLLQLLDVSRIKVGTNMCAAPVAFTTETDALQTTKGTSTNTWGCNLTPSWVKDANFGIALAMTATANNANVYIDYVELTVYYHGVDPIGEPFALAAVAFSSGNAPVQVLNEIAGVGDQRYMKRALCRIKAETESIIEETVIVRILLKVLDEVVQIADTYRRRFTQMILNTIQIATSKSWVRVVRKFASDALQISESKYKTKYAVKYINEVVNIVTSILTYITKYPYGGLGIVLSDNGARTFLRTVLNNTVPIGGRNLTLRLFVNNHWPSDMSVISNFTEAAGGGYAAKTLLNGWWTVSINEDGVPEAVYAEQVFTFTGALTNNSSIYGYYIVDTNGTLIYAERTDLPFQPLSIDNCHFDVVPRFRLSKGSTQ